MLQFIKENISKLPDYQTRNYYYPFTCINTSNLNLLTKLFLTSAKKDSEMLIYEPEGYKIFQTSAAGTYSNKIVLTDFNNIYRFRYYKSYDTKTRPSTIAKARDEHKINYAKFGESIYLDVRTNTLLIDSHREYYFSETTNEQSILFAIFIMKQLMTDENKVQLADAIAQIVQKTKEYFLSYLQEIVDKVTDDIRFATLKSTINNTKATTQDFLRSIIRQNKAKKDQVIQEFKKADDALLASMQRYDKIDEKLSALETYLMRLLKEEQITKIESRPYSDYITITTNYLHMDYIDMDQLDRVVSQNQLRLSEHRLEALKKVLNYEASIITLPIQIKMYIKDLDSPAFTTYFRPILIDSVHYTNLHAAHNSGTGCLGSFKLPLEIAKAEYDIHKAIALYIQYLRSITVHDVLGNRMISESFIIDNDTKRIISAPTRPVFEGFLIKDVIEKDLIQLSNSYLEEVKEKLYGNQTNE